MILSVSFLPRIAAFSSESTLRLAMLLRSGSPALLRRPAGGGNAAPLDAGNLPVGRDRPRRP
jgi:hypothetical protein